MAKKTTEQKKGKELPAITLQGRAVLRDFERVYGALKEIIENIKEDLVNGTEPLSVLLTTIDDLDFVKLQCTAPCVALHHDFYTAITMDETDEPEDDRTLAFVNDAEEEICE